MKTESHNKNFDFDKLPEDFKIKAREWLGDHIEPIYAYLERTASFRFAIVVGADETNAAITILRMFDISEDIAVSVDHQAKFEPDKIIS